MTRHGTSADRTPRIDWAAVAIAVMGLGAARLGYAPFEFRQAMLVLVSGWVVILVGYTTSIRAPWSRTGLLLLVSAAAWYVPAFRWLAFEPAAGLAEGLQLLWAAAIGHALVTYPSGRVSRGAGLPIVGAIYVVSLLPPELAMPLVAALVAAILIGTQVVVAPRHPGREGSIALVAGLAFCLVLATYGAASTFPLGLPIDTRVILQLAFMGTAAALAMGLAWRASQGIRVVDLVVELGPRAAGLEARLGQALGDPSVRVGIWLPEEARYVDPVGGPFAVPAPTASSSVMAISKGAKPVAILVRDPRLATDRAPGPGVARATELWAANATLQADLRTQVEDLRASRARLLEARDDARDWIERRLDHEVRAALARLEARLWPGDDAILGAAVEIRRLVVETRDDLGRLTRGLHPGIEDEHGLAGAIDLLAARSEVPVEVLLAADLHASTPVRQAILFIVGEALANVTKHAHATHVTIAVAGDEHIVRVDIEDDGCGGAEIRADGGLQGMCRRIEALGGRLSITSTQDRGTRLQVAMPVRQGEPLARDGLAAG